MPPRQADAGQGTRRGDLAPGAAPKQESTRRCFLASGSVKDDADQKMWRIPTATPVWLLLPGSSVRAPSLTLL
ncbi:hypothetical protein F7Q96_19475 [Cupriavidus gilardii]|nr:hypothetical protein F7Q96_19475 [Cupriavidus gilardii]